MGCEVVAKMLHIIQILEANVRNHEKIKKYKILNSKVLELLDKVFVLHTGGTLLVHIIISPRLATERFKMLD